MAGGAGAKWVIKGEQARLRHFILDAAIPALEQLAEEVNGGVGQHRVSCRAGGRVHRRLDLKSEGLASTLEIGCLHRVGDAAKVLRPNFDAIDNDTYRRLFLQHCQVDLLERHRLTTDNHPTKSFSMQAVEYSSDRRRRPMFSRLRLIHSSVVMT